MHCSMAQTFFQNALITLFCPCVPAHRRPGRSRRSRTRSARQTHQPRALNLGVLFRAPSHLRLNADLNFDTEGATPCADPTIVVTSSYVTPHHGSPRDGDSGDTNPVSQCTRVTIKMEMYTCLTVAEDTFQCGYINLKLRPIDWRYKTTILSIKIKLHRHIKIKQKYSFRY